MDKINPDERIKRPIGTESTEQVDKPISSTQKPTQAIREVVEGDTPDTPDTPPAPPAPPLDPPTPTAANNIPIAVQLQKSLAGIQAMLSTMVTQGSSEIIEKQLEQEAEIAKKAKIDAEQKRIIESTINELRESLDLQKRVQVGSIDQVLGSVPVVGGLSSQSLLGYFDSEVFEQMVKEIELATSSSLRSSLTASFSSVDPQVVSGIVDKEVAAINIEELVKTNSLFSMIFLSQTMDEINKLTLENSSLMADVLKKESRDILNRLRKASAKREKALQKQRRAQLAGRILNGIATALAVAAAAFTGGASLTIIAAISVAQFANDLTSNIPGLDGQTAIGALVSGALKSAGVEEEKAERIAATLVTVAFVAAQLGVAIGPSIVRGISGAVSKAASSAAVKSAEVAAKQGGIEMVEIGAKSVAKEAAEAVVEEGAEAAAKVAAEAAAKEAAKTAASQALAESTKAASESSLKFLQTKVFWGNAIHKADLATNVGDIGNNAYLTGVTFDANQQSIKIKEADLARIDNQAITQMLSDFMIKIIKEQFQMVDGVRDILKTQKDTNISISSNV